MNSALPDIYPVSGRRPDRDRPRIKEDILNSSAESRFSLLYEDHADRVARYIARRTSADDVQDLVAETFLTAWRRLDDLPEDAIPWLFGTARKHIANRHRSTQRRRALNLKLSMGSVWLHHQPGLDELPEIDQRLLAAIAHLPDAEREAFMLVAWDGLDTTRASRAAGCSTATFRVRLHRARRRLRRELTEHGPVACLSDIRTTMEES